MTEKDQQEKIIQVIPSQPNKAPAEASTAQVPAVELPAEEVEVFRQVVNSNDPKLTLHELIQAGKIGQKIAEKYVPYIRHIMLVLINTEFSPKDKLRSIKALKEGGTIPENIFWVFVKLLAEKHFTEEGDKLVKDIEDLEAEVKNLQGDITELESKILVKEGSLDKTSLDYLKLITEELYNQNSQKPFVSVELLISILKKLALTPEGRKAYIESKLKEEQSETIQLSELPRDPVNTEVLEELVNFVHGTFDYEKFKLDLEKIDSYSTDISEDRKNVVVLIDRILIEMDKFEGLHQVKTDLIEVGQLRVKEDSLLSAISEKEGQWVELINILKERFPKLAEAKGFVEPEKPLETSEMPDIDETIARFKQQSLDKSKVREKERLVDLAQQLGLKELIRLMRTFPAIALDTEVDIALPDQENKLTTLGSLLKEYEEAIKYLEIIQKQKDDTRDKETEQKIIQRLPHMKNYLLGILKVLAPNFSDEEAHSMWRKIKEMSTMVGKSRPKRGKKKGGFEEEDEQELGDEDFINRFLEVRQRLPEKVQTDLAQLTYEQGMIRLVGILRLISKNIKAQNKLGIYGYEVLKDAWLDKLERIMKLRLYNEIYKKRLNEIRKSIETKAVDIWSQLKHEKKELDSESENNLRQIKSLHDQYKGEPVGLSETVEKEVADLVSKFQDVKLKVETI
ncbi:MAG: hypothetical protein HYW77_03475 [Parcubacteria group bacterium]|nr:hypothetical protein [Parcubacteria group bacterium]